jgi:hypothetical protein
MIPFEQRETMIYVKSLLTALAALIAYAFLFAMFGVRLLLPAHTAFKGSDLSEGVSYVSNSPWVRVPLWGPTAIGLFVFSAAFFWTFRTLRRARAQQR